jgi:tetratricopeptide (TPR) repeat protein
VGGRLSLAAAGLAVVALLSWAPPASAETRVSAVCGVAAGGSIRVGGSISIICTPRALLDLIHEQQAFRDAQSERIKQIATDLNLSRCEAEELVAAVAREPPPPGEIGEWLARLARERRSRPAPDQDRVREDGIAEQGSIDVERHLAVGIPPEDLEELMQQVRRVDERYLARLEGLASDLRFSRCATANFLAILGQKEVPPEQLSDKLTEIANGHLKLVERLRALTTRDPKIAELRARATAAIAGGDYETADRLLRDADAIVSRSAPAVSPVMRDKAQIVAARAELERAQLRYMPAAELFEEAASHFETAGNAPDQARYLDLAGGAYQDAGLYTRAQTLYEEALQCSENHQDEVPEEAVITILNNIGGLYFAQSDYTNAIDRFSQALQATRCGEGLDAGVQVALEAASHGGLADAKVTINDFDSAEDHYAQALSLTELVHGGDHPTLVPILTNWAWLETIRGEYGRAESLYLRAVAINDTRDPAGPLEAAATQNNLAGLYYSLRRYDEAESLWTRVKGVYEAQLGEDHHATLVVSQNIAKALMKRGKLSEAERLYDHALAVWETNARKKRQVEKTHLVIASLHAGLADLYVRQHRLDEAKKKYDKAISLAESQLGDDEIVEQSLVIAGYENDRAVVYERLGDLEAARDDLQHALGTMASKLGEDHPDSGTAASNLARVLMRLGRLDDAVPLYRTAITVAERSQRPPLVASRSRNLAKVYQGLGNLAEARRQLEKTRRIYQELGPEYAERLEAVEGELAALDGEAGR